MVTRRSQFWTAKLAARNVAAGAGPFFCGAGAYKHHVPSAVDHLIQRSEFLTSYTPYQPEIAQGTLQYLFEFQTQVALLTGMEVANASLYDGASALAEACLMAVRANRKSKTHRVLMPRSVHPHYRKVASAAAGNPFSRSLRPSRPRSAAAPSAP